MSESKGTFISKTNFELTILKRLKSAWELLINVANFYDGKVLNKKFLNKAQEELTKAGFNDIFINFVTDWRGNRQNRLEVWRRDNYCCEAKCYIESTRLKDTLYGEKDYIDESSFRLNAENFRLAVEYNNKGLENRIEELTECVEKIDEIIEKYENMRKYVETTLDSIPHRLREFISVPIPIYK